MWKTGNFLEFNYGRQRFILQSVCDKIVLIPKTTILNKDLIIALQ